MNKKYENIIQFVPIVAFGLVVRLTSENGANWKLAFIIGACFAVIEKAILVVKRSPLDRLLLGVDMFLIIGGVGFLFNISLILDVYQRLIQATLFAFLLAVGVLTTFLSERGFVGIKHHEQRLVLIYSLWLLGAGMVAFFVSLAFRGNYLLAGILPFTGMIVVNRILIKKLRDTSNSPQVEI